MTGDAAGPAARRRRGLVARLAWLTLLGAVGSACWTSPPAEDRERAVLRVRVLDIGDAGVVVLEADDRVLVVDCGDGRPANADSVAAAVSRSRSNRDPSAPVEIVELGAPCVRAMLPASIPAKTCAPDACAAPGLVISLLDAGESAAGATVPDWVAALGLSASERWAAARISFGRGTVLVPAADLRGDALTALVRRHADGAGIRADVLIVPDHGGPGGVTRAFLERVAPRVAVIPCEGWSRARGRLDPQSAWSRGRPRKSVVELLAEFVAVSADGPRELWAADAPGTFGPVRTDREILLTTGLGDVVLELSDDGTVTVLPR